MPELGRSKQRCCAPVRSDGLRSDNTPYPTEQPRRGMKAGIPTGILLWSSIIPGTWVQIHLHRGLACHLEGHSY